jgi:hypothetical protein
MHSNVIINTYGKDAVALIKHLSNTEKAVLGLCFLQIQEPLVKSFDSVYDENLLAIYLSFMQEGIDAILGNNTQIKQIIDIIERSIPDTDKYGLPEGVYAQNALIGSCYFFSFILSNDSNDILTSIEKYFESVDAIIYELNDNEDSVLNEEIKLIKTVITMIKETHSLDKSGISEILNSLRKVKCCPVQLYNSRYE